jgi:DNA-binding LytR/AlgR family response regulator
MNSVNSIAICDDRQLERELLRAVLENFFVARREEIRIVGYASGEGLLADLEEGYEQFDLYFLDIYMDGMTGLETAHRLREMQIRSAIIFLTSSPDFAVESYDVEASGYLLKPLNEVKLTALLNRLLQPKERRRVCVRCGRETQYVFLDEISWLESKGNMVFLHKTDGSTLETREKLSDLEQQLDDKRFLRCHQSYLVNMDCVNNVQDGFLMNDGATVPIRVRSHNQIAEQYHTYFVSRAVQQLPGGDGYV